MLDERLLKWVRVTTKLLKRTSSKVILDILYKCSKNESIVLLYQNKEIETWNEMIETQNNICAHGPHGMHYKKSGVKGLNNGSSDNTSDILAVKNFVARNMILNRATT